MIGLQSQQPRYAAAKIAAVVEPGPRRVAVAADEPGAEGIRGQLADGEFDTLRLPVQRRAGGHGHTVAIQQQPCLGRVEHHRSPETLAKHLGDQFALGRVEVGSSRDQENLPRRNWASRLRQHAAKPGTRPLHQRRGF